MRILSILFFCSLSFFTEAQLEVELNAWIDIEQSIGQTNSHYYYNEIHKDFKTLRLGIHNANFLTKVTFKESFKLNARLSQVRYKGKKLNTLHWPLLNLQYSPEGKSFAISLGRFITPFGYFNTQQHSKKRTFINLPLAHSYYNKISAKTGFLNFDMDHIVLDGKEDWGTTLLYYGGYSNGILTNWQFNDEKIKLSAAITNGSASLLSDLTDFSDLGFIARLKFQPKYFWEQAFSINYGTFSQASKEVTEVSSEDVTVSNFILGTDAVLGFGHWEFVLELMYGSYLAPTQTSVFDGQSTPSEDNFNLFSGYLNIKYELPAVSGLYLAYGLDVLHFFSETTINGDTQIWGKNVLRQNIGIGYKVNEFLLLRTNFMTQSVKDKAAWEQNTFRTTLTAHF